MPQVWLVTGASSGFGLELVKIIAGKVRIDHKEPLDKIQSTIEHTLTIYGTVDIVVNNATYVQTGILEEVSPEDTLRQFQANTLGTLNLYCALLPHLREKRTGTLITIASKAAWYPMAGCNLYNASKAALRWLAIGLADEVAQFVIRHCLVEPGFFRTGLLDSFANIAGTDKSSRLNVYTDLNAKIDTNIVAFNGAQLGDPVKGTHIIFDVTTSSGVAEGKELPELLPLGSDASTEIEKAASKVQASVEEWKNISALSDIKE